MEKWTMEIVSKGLDIVRRYLGILNLCYKQDHLTLHLFLIEIKEYKMAFPKF